MYYSIGQVENAESIGGFISFGVSGDVCISIDGFHSEIWKFTSISFTSASARLAALSALCTTCFLIIAMILALSK